ncbi:MAG: hypothetical protein ACOY71_02590 [Gemmatimonadota bacterium]
MREVKASSPLSKAAKGWMAGAIGVAAALLVAVFRFPGVIRGVFQFMLDNLPLTLPVLTVVMSIALDPRGLRSKDGLLRLTGPIALGLVSFAIWYYVAAQAVPDYIFISPQKVLTKEYSLLLLISAFIWAGFCFVVGILNEIQGHADGTWLGVRIIALALSIAFLMMPFALFEGKSEVERRIGASLDLKRFMVAIPYRDAALNQHLGRSTDPVTQVHTYPGVMAKTPDAAVRIALDSFLVSPASMQFNQSNPRGTAEGLRRVDVLEAWIVAQEKP